MCGDSTKAEDVRKLAAGRRADLLLTDPPYNVAIGDSNERRGGKNTDLLANDDLAENEFIEFLTKAFTLAEETLNDGAAFYIWYAAGETRSFLQAIENANLSVRQYLNWIKNHFTLGRQDYQWRTEPCFYGWKEGAPHYFIDMRTLDSTFNSEKLSEMSKEQLEDSYRSLTALTDGIYEDKPNVSEDHPTMKPVPLFEKLVRNSSREGDTVLDLFGGSGTTLLACEKMGRKCLMMEYEPKYCDVIIRRWEEQTGRKAIKEA